MLEHSFDFAACFSRDYAEARLRILGAARTQAGRVRSYVNPHRGPDGEELAADIAMFGREDASRMLVLLTGVHGVEGFAGSAVVLDLLQFGLVRALPHDVKLMVIHAINPYGFAWLRRVTEENVDLNRNFVDFSREQPRNPGHDELVDAIVPREMSGPVFDAALAKIAAFRTERGEKAYQLARSGGQHHHPLSMGFGGNTPTWARRTLEQAIADHADAHCRKIAVIDVHTGMGPFGYGELICVHRPGTAARDRARAWYGESVTEPLAGTSVTVMKSGLINDAWSVPYGDDATYVALEYGTYSIDRSHAVLREELWLNAYGRMDWNDPETRRIKRALRKQFYPDSDDWKEMVLSRSRQVARQALAGLMAQ